MPNEINAVIVEDVLEFHAVIETLLDEVAPNIKVIGNASTLLQAEDLIKKLSPQLVFLDIQFDAEGKTAFDLLRKLEDQKLLNFQIIVITAFNQGEYYDAAFNYGALHFLTKPIDKLKLQQAIARVSLTMHKMPEQPLFDQFRQFHEQVHQSRSSDKIVIDGLNCAEIVQLRNIVYFEAAGRYTYIHTISNSQKPICSSLNLGEYEKKLGSRPYFIRVHRNLIVNTNYILRFSKKDRSITLPDPFKKQYASRDRFKEFVQFLDESL